MKLPNTGLATLNDNKRALLRELFFESKEYPLAVDLGNYVAVQFYNKRIGEWDVWIYEAKKYYRDANDVKNKITKLIKPIVINKTKDKET